MRCRDSRASRLCGQSQVSFRSQRRQTSICLRCNLFLPRMKALVHSSPMLAKRPACPTCCEFPPKHPVPEHPTEWEFPSFLGGTPWIDTLREVYAHPLAFPASISPEVGLLLYSLVRNIRPMTVVETGTFIAVSTIWIAAAAG